MILIADCGSTKTDWCLLNGKEKEAQVFTQGMNALMLSEDEMAAIIAKELMPHISVEDVTDVYYYGAGCISAEICGSVERAIRRNMPQVDKVEVNTDLLAAARAVCGNKPGIACIMGTGSNSCYYDGEKIVDNVSPLGYILGDEGSGAVLGKRLVGDVLKRQLSTELTQKFLDTYQLTPQLIIENVYRKPGANRFLASLSPFLIQHIEEPAIHRLVLNEFKAFFVRNVENYSNYKELPVNFVGSVAMHYRSVLEEAASALFITIGTVIKSPMEGLVKFHGK
ncbi:MAG: ATPase [Muribaculaceae bacterium]